jgi:hypothetical protein
MQEAATSWDLRSLVTFPNFLMMAGVTLFVFFVPIIKLLRRTGHHAIWCLFALVPGLNLIAFWIFAFKPWPMDKASVKAAE